MKSSKISTALYTPSKHWPTFLQTLKCFIPDAPPPPHVLCVTSDNQFPVQCSNHAMAFYDLTVMCTSAVEGEDFVIETKNIRFSGETTSVVVTFREDGVALEEDETFVLRLSGSRQAFFVNTLAVTISDPEGKDAVLRPS